MDFTQYCILFVAVVESVMSVEVTEPASAIESVLSGSENITLKTVSSFEKYQIVPDIIPVSPKILANVTFPNGVIVSLGHKLTPTQVRFIPEVSWDADPSQYYTLLAIDPDMPSRQSPVYRSSLHWCVINIPGDDIAGGNTTAEYISAVPLEKSGLHRFIFLVYKQPGIVDYNDTKLNNTSSNGRFGFSVTDFTMKYNLSDPLAGNFFQTSYDSYVPNLLKILGRSHANTVAPERLFGVALGFVLFWNRNHHDY